MPDEASAKVNLSQQLAINAKRMEAMLHAQYNVEITRGLVLCFSSPEEDCAKAISKALFAKGMRVLKLPVCKPGGRCHVRVAVKRSIRDAVREEFVTDLVHTAAGMNGSYDGWDLLTEDAAEETQTHADTPDVQQSPAANVPQDAH